MCVQIQDIVSSFSTHGRMRYPYVGITMVELNQGALRHVQADLPQLLGRGAAVMVQVRVCSNVSVF